MTSHETLYLKQFSTSTLTTFHVILSRINWISLQLLLKCCHKSVIDLSLCYSPNFSIACMPKVYKQWTVLGKNLKVIESTDELESVSHPWLKKDPILLVFCSLVCTTMYLCCPLSVLLISSDQRFFPVFLLCFFTSIHNPILF